MLLALFIPVAVSIPALATAGVLAGALVILIVVETHAYGEARRRTRDALRHERAAGQADP